MGSTLEITVQRRGESGWPVVVEHHRMGQLLPVRSEGELVLTGEPASTSPQAYGEELGRALFTGPIRDAYVAARGHAPVRVWLCVEDRALWTWRWEWLCAPVDSSRWDFLSLDQRALYSLYLPSLTDRPYPPIGRDDLRALVLVANPADPGNRYRLAAFDSLAPVARLQAIFKGRVSCDVLGRVAGAVGPATLDALVTQLTSGAVEGPYSIIHIVCHGRFDGESNETWVYLEQSTADQSGVVLAQPVSASELIERLARVRQLPYLVFLSVCESSVPEAEQRLGGLAQRLVRELGIPAVIGMTEPVTVATAHALSDAFYTRLLQPSDHDIGAVDCALVQAYAGLASRLDVHVPALYSRLGDQPLFSPAVDRDLTGGEIRAGLAQLDALLAERAPVLRPDLAKHRQALEPWLATDPATLSADARQIREASLQAITEICQEALDISFHALVQGKPIPPYDARQPFRGLSPFRAEDREFFFGRNALIDMLLRKLADDPFLPVLGPSGSGKSSVVLAGLVPRLQHDQPNLQVAYLTPGSTPLEQLRAVQATLRDGPVLYVVDQFEEVFSACRDEAQRLAFIEALLELTIRDPVVLTMRADFWGECAPYRALRARMQARQELIAPMTTAELRAAMEQQAAKVGLRFEADLSHTMLDEVAGEPGAMPLLQHALLELWKRRHGRWLRAAEYRAIGGVKRAIAETAERLYAELSPADQERMRDIFLRLTQLDKQTVPGEERRDTRRRVPFTELVPAGTDPEATKRLVKQLADAVLVTTSRNPVTGQDEVEVAHEALIRHWARLLDWLNDDLMAVRLRGTITEAAKDWSAHQDDEALLVHRGARLLAVEALLAHRFLRFSVEERRYIDASLELRSRERQRAERETAAEQEKLRLEALAAHEREQAAVSREKATQTIARRTRVAAVVSVLLAVGAVTGGILALKRGADATRAALRARAGQLTALSEAVRPQSVDLSGLLALEALRAAGELGSREDPEIEQALRNAAATIGGIPLDYGSRFPRIQFSPDGRWLVTAQHDEPAHVTIWLVPGTFPSRPTVWATWPESNVVRDITFLDHAKRLLIRDDSKAVLVDLTQKHSHFGITALPSAGVIVDDSVNSTGNLLAVVDRIGDRYVSETRLLTLVNGRIESIRTVTGETEVTVVKLHEGHQLLATASRFGQIRLWRVAPDGTVSSLRTLHVGDQKRPSRGVTSLEFSPDGSWLAAVTDEPLFGDGSVFLWKLKDPSPAPNLIMSGHKGRIVLAFSADGRWIASVGEGGHHAPNTSIWIARLQAERPARIHKLDLGGGSRDLAISEDSTLIAVATDVGLKQFRISPTGDPEPADVDQAFKEPLTTVRFSPSRRWLVLGGHGVVWLKQLTGPERLRAPIRLNGHTGWVNGVALSPDSRYLVTVSDDAARLWDLTNPQPAIDPIRVPNRNWIKELSPAGTETDLRIANPYELASMYYQPNVQDSAAVLKRRGETSPDGRWSLTKQDPFSTNGSNRTKWGDETAALWSLRDEQSVALSISVLPRAAGSVEQLRKRNGSFYIDQAVYSPDSRWLIVIGRLFDATSNETQTAEVFRLDDNRVEGPWALPIAHLQAQKAAFSPDGTYFAAIPYFGKGDFQLWRVDAPRWWEGELLMLHGTSEVDASRWAFNSPDAWFEFSSDSKWLLVRNGHAEMKLCRLKGPAKLIRCQQLRGHEHNVDTRIFVPGARWLLTSERRQRAGGPLKALLWDLGSDAGLETPKVLLEYEPPESKADVSIGVSVSESGRWAVLGGGRATELSLYDLLADNVPSSLVKLPGHKLESVNAGWTMTFSADDRLLATAQTDERRVHLWDLTRRGNALTASMFPADGAIRSLALSPDGSHLAIGAGTIAVRDLRRESIGAVTLSLRGGLFSKLVSSRDGRFLWAVHPTTSGEDVTAGGAEAFRTDVMDVRKALSASVSRNMSLTEWQTYFPERQYQKTIEALPTGSGVLEDLLGRARQLVDASKHDEARAAYALAARFAVSDNDPAACNEVAWQGALSGFAASMVQAAEHAVQLAPNQANYVDTRGLVRALNGDRVAAILDFKLAVAIAEQVRLNSFVQVRRRWIEQLSRGEDPFTQEALRTLRQRG